MFVGKTFGLKSSGCYMALLRTTPINQEHDETQASHMKLVLNGFSTESEFDSEDECSSADMKMKVISDSTENALNQVDDDNDDGWCILEDIDDDTAPENISMESILSILSVADWPEDVAAKYRTFEQEVLSHEVILQRTWIRIKRECTKSVNVRIHIPFHLFFFASASGTFRYVSLQIGTKSHHHMNS